MNEESLQPDKEKVPPGVYTDKHASKNLIEKLLKALPGVAVTVITGIFPPEPKKKPPYQ